MRKTVYVITTAMAVAAFLGLAGSGQSLSHSSTVGIATTAPAPSKIWILSPDAAAAQAAREATSRRFMKVNRRGMSTAS